MKKILMCIVALATVCFSGCTPTEEQINKTAVAVGYAAGLVVNQTKIDDITRNAVVQVLGEVRSCVPSDGQSYADAWKPIIESKVAELVQVGKLNEKYASLVIKTASYVPQAVDYFFEKYPKIKKYEGLVKAGVSGVIDGFLDVVKPVNCSDCEDCEDRTVRSMAKKDYDKDAYEWFKENLK